MKSEVAFSFYNAVVLWHSGSYEKDKQRYKTENERAHMHHFEFIAVRARKLTKIKRFVL